MKKCICYSLWGNKLEYLCGLEKNFYFIEKNLPDWEMVVYYDSSVPEKYINENDKIEWIKNENDKCYGMFWRYEHVNKCDVFLSRDLDSRISEREVYCIKKWENSKQKLLSIRDHPIHYGLPYMGGLLGIKNGLDDDDIKTMKNYSNNFRYNVDQDYFKYHIYPKYIEQTLFLGPKEDKFLEKTWNKHFMGQGYYEDDSFRYDPKTGSPLQKSIMKLEFC